MKFSKKINRNINYLNNIHIFLVKMGGLFKEMLGSSETLFKNDLALDFSFVPKMDNIEKNEKLLSTTVNFVIK